MSRTERRKQAADELKKEKNRSRGRKERFDKKQKEKAEIIAAGKEKAESVEKMTESTASSEIEGKNSKVKTKGKKFARFKNWFKGLKTWKKALFISAIAILIIVIVGGAAVYAYFNSIFDEIHEPTPEDYDLSLVDVDGYYNILLLGVDSRDMDNLDDTRSDAIMMVSINKDTNDVKVLSVYRDTYIKMGDTSTYDKITHACFYGGPEMTMKTMNQAMDLNISNYVVVNFKAVADLVDAVGGIEVDVQEYEINQLNKYTIETAENIGRKDYKLVKKPGVQTLEGVQAVSYGRIRKGVGDDFKRTERMRTVLSLVMDKMKDMSFKDLKKIIKMMTPQVKTNLSRNDILGLAIRLPQYNIKDTTGWPYNVSTGYIGGVSYVFPANLAENVIRMHKEFFGQDDYSISATASNISSAIAQRIEAARQSNELKDEKKEVQPNNPQGNGSSKPSTSEPSTKPAEPETPATPPVTPTEPTEPTEPSTPTEPTVPGDNNNNPGTGTDTPNTGSGSSSQSSQQ